PEIAAEIGILMSCAAMVEWYLHQLIAKLGVDHRDAFVIAGQFQSFSVRIDLLQRLAALRDDKNIDRQAVEIFIPKLRTSNSIRNKYAHAQYGTGPTENSIIIYPFSGDVRKKPESLTVTIDDVVEDVNFMKALCCELSDYVTHGTMPTP